MHPSLACHNQLNTQTWGDAVFGVGVAIALGLIYWLASPYTRNLFIYDATISYSDDAITTIPSWACFVVRCWHHYVYSILRLATVNAPQCIIIRVQVPFALLIINVSVVEFALRNIHGWTMATAFLIHFILQGIYCYLFTLLITQITNFIVGYPRPEFLSRCQPANTTFPTSFSANGPAQPVVCTNPNTNYVLDGLKSFPSGTFFISHCSLFASPCNFMPVVVVVVAVVFWGGDLCLE